MSESARGLDDDRLQRLVRDLEAIVRRELPWYDGNQHDPSIALVELLAFLGDTLTEYQSRLAGETYLETRSRLLVTIGASPWRKVASLESEIHAGPGRISFAPPRRSWRDCLARLFGGRR